MLIVVRNLLLLGLCALAGGAAVAEQYRLTLQSTQVDDSDDARQAGYYLRYRHSHDGRPDVAYIGAGLGSFSVDDRNGKAEFAVFNAEFRQPLSEAVALKLDAAQLLGSDWSTWTGAGALIVTPHPRWYLELFTARDLVDTSTAIGLHNSIDTFGVSADYRINDNWTVVGAGFTQSFEDGNERLGRVGRLLWEAAAIDWFRAELRLRRLDTDFRGVGYFSPDQLEEGLLLATASTPIFNDNAVVSLQLGAGQQRIDGGDGRGLYLAEFKGRGWLTSHWGMETKLGCKNTGDVNLATTADEYRYCYADLALYYAW